MSKPRTNPNAIKSPQTDVSFPKLEESMLRAWKREKTFEESLERTRNGKRYTFYDGPPFATGLPHYGHLLQGTIKDVIPRFRTMQGRYVERRFGWDCHGLPVEYELEKELGIRHRQDILEMGVGKFNDACRRIVLRYTKEWEKTTTRLGRWIDFKNDYKTMDPDYMESIWWVVKQLWEKNLLYEGRRAMQICPRCATPLSNFEVSQGYADRDDPSVYVGFPLRDNPDVSLLAWTTTPWTLPGNVLAAVNKHLTYVEAEYKGKRYIVAEPRLGAVWPDHDYVKRKTLRAEELIGKQYEPPFPKRNLTGTSYEVVAADVVTADEGTGILHVAPAFGEEDMEIGKRENAAFIQHIDITGTVTGEAPRYKGLQALAANEPIIADLKKSGRLLRKEMVRHSYPHCWRCDTPLLNFATTSWFVAVTKFKSELLVKNEKIDWTPAHVKHGRFGKWLEGARDWSVSRNRFWGNPLPIWRCEATDGEQHITVVGSRDELEQLSGQRPKDLHKQYVDKITFPCPQCGAPAKRIEDVLDCWFESGSMPYAKEHYPFEHKRDFRTLFPADFIAEGLDQTRGWFYTLHVLGTALFDSPAFLSVVITGMIQAEDGKKMSKRLKNYPEPEEIFKKYGADALRLYLMTEPIVRGDDLRFREKGVEECLRNFSSTLYNVYSFFATYAAVDGWVPPAKLAATAPVNVLDRWIHSRLQSVTGEVTDALERNDLMTAARTLLEFLDEVSNWYVRRSRRRFWKSEDDQDKAAAYATLYEVLTTFLRLAAPITPFITDHLYRKLTGESVHLAEWPTASANQVDSGLEQQMALAREVVRLGLAARSAENIKVRQPLAEVFGPAIKNRDIVQIVKEELNVKKYEIFDEASGAFSRVAHPKPRVIAQTAGTRTQEVIRAIKDGRYTPKKDGTYVVENVKLPSEAIDMHFARVGSQVVEGSPQATVSLETKLDQALLDEGRAREVIRLFQELRKESGLKVDDRITAQISTEDPDLERALGAHRDLIANEILARSLELVPDAGDNAKSVTVDGASLAIALSRVRAS